MAQMIPKSLAEDEETTSFMECQRVFSDEKNKFFSKQILRNFQNSDGTHIPIQNRLKMKLII